MTSEHTRIHVNIVASRARVGAFSKEDRSKRACRNVLHDYSDLDSDEFSGS